MTYLFGQARILLQKLYDAVGQLGMVHGERFDLVKWHQDLKKNLVLSFFMKTADIKNIRPGFVTINNCPKHRPAA